MSSGPVELKRFGDLKEVCYVFLCLSFIHKTKQNTTEYRQISPKSYNKDTKIAKSIAVTDALKIDR